MGNIYLLLLLGDPQFRKNDDHSFPLHDCSGGNLIPGCTCNGGSPEWKEGRQEEHKNIMTPKRL